MTSPVTKSQGVLLGLIQALAIASCLFVLPGRALATPRSQQDAATHYVINSQRLNPVARFPGNRDSDPPSL